MPTTKLPDVVGKIVALLAPLTSEDRDRVIRASMTLLGETVAKMTATQKEEENTGETEHVSSTGKARTWQKQNAVSSEQLSHVFHSADGKTDVIAGEMPGKNNKEKTLNAYVLTGIARLLDSGNPTFADKDGRSLCMSAGCYDQANHAAILKGRGNWFTGTKEKGWTLTAPGLKHGASLIKSLTSAND